MGNVQDNALYILIIEDEPDLREALQVKLEVHGFKVVACSDGETGLQTAMTTRPDLMLLDITVPKINGLEILNRVRGDDHWGRHVPIFVLTNHDDSSSMSRATHDKADRYLVKSNNSLDTIVDTIVAALPQAD